MDIVALEHRLPHFSRRRDLSDAERLHELELEHTKMQIAINGMKATLARLDAGRHQE